MSLNDLWCSDLVGFLLIIGCLIYCLVVYVSSWIHAIGRRMERSSYDVKTEKAKVISRQILPHPHNRMSVMSLVIFELEDGQRLEFVFYDASKIVGITGGDTGMLRHQGEFFLSFTSDTEAELAPRNVKTTRAKVISKQLVPNPAEHLAMMNLVIFELKDGQRLQFIIQNIVDLDDAEEGDTGTLRYKGSRFIGFCRDDNA